MRPKIAAEMERTIGHGLPRFTTSEGLFTAAATYLCTCELGRLPSKRYKYVIRHTYLQSIQRQIFVR